MRVSMVTMGVAGILLAGCVAALAPEPPVPSGAEDFAAFCAACHGSDGRGAGEVAATLGKRPADLSVLGKGTAFPAARVMSKIYGYQGDQAARALMPEFGPLLEGETVLFDTGDGIATPTPLRLVQLAEHVKSLQR